MSKFLFECHFKDGSVIQQNLEDESPTTPGKNCFYDVLQRIDEVSVFGLISSDPNNKDCYVVDLNDGTFHVNGAPFIPQDPSKNLTFEDLKYRLVYFKRHRHQIVNGTPTTHTIDYHIGWQTTLPSGENVKQTIAIFGETLWH